MHRFFPVRVITALALMSVPMLCVGATLSAPINGSFIPLPDGQVLCGEASGGWVPDPSGTKIRPPLDATQIGKATSIKVASSAAACAAGKDADVLVVSGPIPAIDRHTVDLWADEGHLDLHGTNLDGSRLEWDFKGERGSDTCVASSTSNGQQSCSYSINTSVPTDLSAVTFRILPAGATGKGEIFDNSGQLVA